MSSPACNIRQVTAQDIANITGVLRTNLVAWLGDASYGIDKIITKELVATNITTGTIRSQQDNTQDFASVFEIPALQF